MGVSARVEPDFSRPDEPTDNALIEASNGKFRSECLNTTGFWRLVPPKNPILDVPKDGGAGQNASKTSMWTAHSECTPA
ncbi:integrase core domain-containing protein [Nitratireductor rhodophyticola]|uniref:integrase core domain-containing protein n=1 Tax=Nitratireductor rhodophyticola TaxID=2854036 RepID=UPI0038F7F84A